MLHFHDSLWKGQRRGMSPLTPAVRKLFSLDDIERASTSGVLMRQRIAYAITKSNQDDDEPTLLPGATLVETVESENPDGSKTRLHIQRITSQDGTDIDIADLPPGREIKIVESEHNNEGREWSEHMLTDIARCTKYPPQYVFFLGGLSQGTEVRMVNKRIQRRKNHVRPAPAHPAIL
jgi:capsid protein